MELYTLDENFFRRDVIDEFNSCVWTERYSKHGDVVLTVPLTKDNLSKLPEGTFLGMKGTQEVMILESALQEKNTLKLTGPTLDKFLQERVIRTTGAHEDRYWNLVQKPGVIIVQIVELQCISGAYVSTTANGIDGPREIIPNLLIQSWDDSGDNTEFAIPYGPVYDAIEQIAETYELGFSLYLHQSWRGGYRLRFKSYKGRDLTSTVKFSPNVDSLRDVKELRSIAGYKNVCYVFAPGNPVPGVTQPGVAYADDEAAASVGFKRRVLMIFADDLTTDKVGGSAATLLRILNQRAKDALANNNYTKTVDGEIVPQNEYQYGKDYRLGDIVELQALSGITSRARITEYIRTQDSTGERAYPTITVLD